MRDGYDFSESRPNPYIGRLREPVMMDTNDADVDRPEAEPEHTGIPHQTVINMRQTEFRDQM